MALVRKICLILPLLAAACATPELPGGLADEQSWFDARVSEGADAEAAPPAIPDKSPARSAESLEAAAQDVLDAREDLLEAERATRPAVTDTESYAQDARDRADPPPPID